MSKTLLLFTILFSTKIVSSQVDLGNLPIDKETNTVKYTSIVDINHATSKDELYLRAKSWITTQSNNSYNHLKVEDKENGMLVGESYFQATVKALSVKVQFSIAYTVSIFVKAGRYKYEFTNFKLHNGYPFEDPVTWKRLAGKNIRGDVVSETDAHIKKLIESLNVSMKKNTIKSDW